MPKDSLLGIKGEGLHTSMVFLKIQIIGLTILQVSKQYGLKDIGLLFQKIR